jgi:hypothetical protein
MTTTTRFRGTDDSVADWPCWSLQSEVGAGRPRAGLVKAHGGRRGADGAAQCGRRADFGVTSLVADQSAEAVCVLVVAKPATGAASAMSAGST